MFSILFSSLPDMTLWHCDIIIGGSRRKWWGAADWSVSPENLSDFSPSSFFLLFSWSVLTEESHLRTRLRWILNPVLLIVSVSWWCSSRHWLLIVISPSLESLESTGPNDVQTGNLCSERSERRGSHQKVVSFSFWGEMETKYWNGIVNNLGILAWLQYLSVDAQFFYRVFKILTCC